MVYSMAVPCCDDHDGAVPLLCPAVVTSDDAWCRTDDDTGPVLHAVDWCADDETMLFLP